MPKTSLVIEIFLIKQKRFFNVVHSVPVSQLPSSIFFSIIQVLNRPSAILLVQFLPQTIIISLPNDMIFYSRQQIFISLFSTNSDANFLSFYKSLKIYLRRFRFKFSIYIYLLRISLNCLFSFDWMRLFEWSFRIVWRVTLAYLSRRYSSPGQIHILITNSDKLDKKKAKFLFLYQF